MARSMHFEDNDDDTITVTINIEGDIITFVLPYGLDTLVDMVSSSEPINEVAERLGERSVIIPNDLEG